MGSGMGMLGGERRPRAMCIGQSARGAYPHGMQMEQGEQENTAAEEPVRTSGRRVWRREFWLELAGGDPPNFSVGRRGRANEN